MNDIGPEAFTAAKFNKNFAGCVNLSETTDFLGTQSDPDVLGAQM
jgi:hypothetical protein